MRGAGCGERGEGCKVRGEGCGVRGARCGVRGEGSGVQAGAAGSGRLHLDAVQLACDHVATHSHLVAGALQRGGQLHLPRRRGGG